MTSTNKCGSLCEAKREGQSVHPARKLHIALVSVSRSKYLSTIKHGNRSQSDTIPLLELTRVLWTYGAEYPPPETHVLRLFFRFELPDYLPPSFFHSGSEGAGAILYSLTTVGVRPGNQTPRVIHIPIVILPQDDFRPLSTPPWSSPSFALQTLVKEKPVRKGLWGDYATIRVEVLHVHSRSDETSTDLHVCSSPYLTSPCTPCSLQFPTVLTSRRPPRSCSDGAQAQVHQSSRLLPRRLVNTSWSLCGVPQSASKRKSVLSSRPRRHSLASTGCLAHPSTWSYRRKNGWASTTRTRTAWLRKEMLAACGSSVHVCGHA